MSVCFAPKLHVYMLFRGMKHEQNDKFEAQAMTASVSKPAYSFTQNVQSFVNHHGIENCGFLTLTFSEKVTCVHEASKRFNSFRTGFLSKIMNGYIGVYERHKSGVIHFHFVVAFKQNIYSEVRGGVVVCFDHEAVKNKRVNRKQRYASANAYLKSLWKLFRQAVPKYGFGDKFGSQILPVYNGKGIARYLAKYLTKGIVNREVRDKGFRLVRSTTGKASWGWRVASSLFAWNSDAAREWRLALRDFILCKTSIARYRLAKYGNRLPASYRGEIEKLASMDETNYSEVMGSLHGANWCYHKKDAIWDDYQLHKGEAVQEFFYCEMAVDAVLKVSYNPMTGEVIEL